jgi:hypothetical protein
MPTELFIHARERDTFIIRAQFTDDAGAAAAPATLTWTLTDGNGAVVNSRSAVPTSPAATMYFVLTNADLSLATPLHGTTRYLLVEGTYDSTFGTGLSLRDQVQFDIDDLIAVTS